MNKKVNFLKKVGQKTADMTISPMCIPFFAYQPVVPAKLQAKMKDKK